MFLKVSIISVWPSRAKINDHMPADFKDKYPSTRVIIDCSELCCQMPKSLRLNSDLFIARIKTGIPIWRSSLESHLGVPKHLLVNFPWGTFYWNQRSNDLWGSCANTTNCLPSNPRGVCEQQDKKLPHMGQSSAFTLFSVVSQMWCVCKHKHITRVQATWPFIFSLLTILNYYFWFSELHFREKKT